MGQEYVSLLAVYGQAPEAAREQEQVREEPYVLVAELWPVDHEEDHSHTEVHHGVGEDEVVEGVHGKPGVGIYIYGKNDSSILHCKSNGRKSAKKPIWSNNQTITNGRKVLSLWAIWSLRE
jgi:hypothetical protein